MTPCNTLHVNAPLIRQIFFCEWGRVMEGQWRKWTQRNGQFFKIESSTVVIESFVINSPSQGVESYHPFYWFVTSVTRLGDLLDFGQVLKAFGNNQFAKISHILSQFFVRVSKSIIFLVKSFLGNFYRHLAIFSVNKTRKKISVQILPENLFFKWAILDLFFVYFRSFSNRQYKFYNKSMQKMSI